MEKEINKQKNKVLKELVDKKEDIKSTKEEKFGLMLKIQKENTQLISECSKIRTDLQDILRFVLLFLILVQINDIEKKFIELTNTYINLNKKEATRSIKENIKDAKDVILMSDMDANNRRPDPKSNFKLTYTILF